MYTTRRFCVTGASATAFAGSLGRPTSLAAQTQAAQTQAAQTQVAFQPWPHTLTGDGFSATVYQPQAIAWPNHETLTARAAIAISVKDNPQPILGTLELELATHTDAATNMVLLSDPQLKASHFPALDTDQSAKLEDRIRAVLPTIRISAVPLNAVLLSLTGQAQPEAVPVNNDPPVIFVSDKPASLVVFDGDPVMVPAGSSGLRYAVNTNWEVFTDGTAWYLLNGGIWLSAPAVTGPYWPVTRLPPGFSHLPPDPVFEAVRKSIPPHAPAGPMPVIFVGTKPAEIIVTEGPPQFAPVPGTGLQAVRNTISTLFFQPSSNQFFLLISGRWFSAPALGGPWTFASDHLPADFSVIPPNGAYASVLPSVPGTAPAQLAVLQAQVPKQATLKRDAAKLTVVYAGPPRFEPIPGTPIQYAVNTSFQVLQVNGRFYACYQGAWFEAPTPTGPWVLAASVPQIIYTIPATSPLYPVTYVKVYAATPTAVTYGYTSGYLMGYVVAGAVVYGTGYYYPPVIIPGPVPIYYPYPYSYCGNVWYNSATGVWAKGGTIYGPYYAATGGRYYNPTTGAYGSAGAIYGPNGGVGGFNYYNPSTGGYAHGRASWNAGGGTAQASYYNPRTGVSGSTNQNWNPYSRWGSSTFTGPNQTVNTGSASNARGSAGAFQSSTGAQGAGYHTATGNRGGAVKTQNGDVYAGHDGNVYQHGSDGWSKWNNGGWQPVNPPSNTNRTSNTAASQNLSGTQNQRTAPDGSQYGARSGAQQGTQQRGTQGARQTQGRQTLDRSSYDQLEQDRMARFSGGQRFGGAAGGAGRFDAGRFRR